MTARTDPRLLPALGEREDSPRARLDRIRERARLVASGRLSPSQVRRLAGEIERLVECLVHQEAIPARGTDDAACGLRSLSARERQVLAALAGGETVQEVAHRLNRSPKTINNQRTSLLRKLGLRNTAELTRFAIREGIITL